LGSGVAANARYNAGDHGLSAAHADTGSAGRHPIAGGKAAPANLSADPGAEVWGVLYQLTRRDLLRLDATEGLPWSWYRPLWLEAEDINDCALQAMTYIAFGQEVDSKPSLRYVTLLRDGARSHGLPQHYIRFLEHVEAAQ
jgi:hypothetical protein